MDKIGLLIVVTILPPQTTLHCNVNFCLFFLLCWLLVCLKGQIFDTGIKMVYLERVTEAFSVIDFWSQLYFHYISIRREGALKLLPQLNKHLARRTIMRTNSFCFIFRSGLEEVYCELSQGKFHTDSDTSLPFLSRI